MSEFRFILGRRVLIVFLALLVATGALLGAPAATQTLAESPLTGSQEVSVASGDSATTEGLPAAAGEKGALLEPSGHSPFLQGESEYGWTKTNTALTGTDTPSARSAHAIAATPSGVLLFGGSGSSGSLGDTWLYNTISGTWGLLTSTDTAPSARSAHAMAATPSGVLLFGGSGSWLNDTWLFNTATNTWGLLDTGSTSPSARYGHAMAATPSGVLLFGGTGSSGACNDTWLFNTATNTWGLLDTGSASPSERAGHAMAATPSGVLLFGGVTGAVLHNDTWLFNTATNTWGLLDTGSASPSARYMHAMAATPLGVLLFGGEDQVGLNPDQRFPTSDTWLFTYDGTGAGAWSDKTASPSTPTNTPSARSLLAMAYEASSGKVLLFGGYDGSSLFNDTWLYDTTGSTATISVTSPTAGATWAVGQTASITWTSTDLSGTCTVDLFRDYGGTWTKTLTTNTPTQGTYNWTVTGTVDTDYVVCVTGKSADDTTVTGTSLTFTITHAETPTLVVLTPSTATILAGASQTYTLIAHDTETNTWDVTSSGTYSITPAAGGAWTSTNVYTASKAGVWTVTASYLGASTTATLEVTHSNTVGSLVLAPATATILAGTPTDYTLTAYDTSTNTWDVTFSGTYWIAGGDDGGTWTNTRTYTASKAGVWTVTASYANTTATALLTITSSPTIAVTSPTGNERWTIGTERDITWTSTGLDTTKTLTILLARDGVNFTETITKELSSALNSYTWTVSGPGTINAKIRVQQDATQGTSPDYFTITSTLFPYIGGTTTLSTSDPWLEISGGTDTGTLWVTPLDPQYTSDPNLSQFIQETGKRSALFFDIGQEGLSGTLTIVLHFNHRLGEETFQLYLWDETTGWVLVPNGTLDSANHTFTFTIDAALLLGTPFGLGGNPAAMPGLSPWALALLSLALLGMGGWWFLRRRGIA